MPAQEQDREEGRLQAPESDDGWLRVAIVAVLGFLVIVLSIVYIYTAESHLQLSRVPSIVLSLGVLSAAFVSACLYLLPAILACLRGKPKAPKIFILNSFFGWTVVGWLAVLAWALARE